MDSSDFGTALADKDGVDAVDEYEGIDDCRHKFQLYQREIDSKARR